MGRNYFSRAGGPYFINDGFSKHKEHHEDPNHIKPDKGLFITIVVSFAILLAVIGTVLNSF